MMKSEILIVDDDEGLRSMMAKVLVMKGFRVIQARSGRGAASAFVADPGQFAAAILDVDLPELSGFQVADIMWKARPDFPILFVSGGPESSEARGGSGPRGDCFLAKPFSIEELCERVAALIGAGQARVRADAGHG